jgi:hypothetical protein
VLYQNRLILSERIIHNPEAISCQLPYTFTQTIQLGNVVESNVNVSSAINVSQSQPMEKSQDTLGMNISQMQWDNGDSVVSIYISEIRRADSQERTHLSLENELDSSLKRSSNSILKDASPNTLAIPLPGASEENKLNVTPLAERYQALPPGFSSAQARTKFKTERSTCLQKKSSGRRQRILSSPSLSKMSNTTPSLFLSAGKRATFTYPFLMYLIRV